MRDPEEQATADADGRRRATGLVDTGEKLAELIPHLEPHPRVALDTEADSLHCYKEKLCLVQLSVPGRDELVDPLAGFSLEPLYTCLRTRSFVIHGADYDLRLLRRAGFEGKADVFDTMIAARLCGIAEFSYAALVKRFFGIELVKGSQKANWGRRPLTDKMVEYARNDTRYLLEIAARLEEELASLGRSEWFRQSVDKVVAATAVTREKDLDQAWRIPGSHELRGRAAAVLRALWQWREAEASKVDRPCFHILQNTELVAAAREYAEGREPEFRHLRGGRLERFRAAAREGMALPEDQWPKRPFTPRFRATAEQEALLNRLKQTRDARAAEFRLEASLIAPKSALEGIAYAKNPPEEHLLPWQRALLGV